MGKYGLPIWPIPTYRDTSWLGRPETMIDMAMTSPPGNQQPVDKQSKRNNNYDMT